MPDTILFDSNDIVVHYNEGKTDFVLVTFIGIGHEHNANSIYFGKPLVEDVNISCIGVTTKIRNWYYSNNMHTALRLIQKVAERYRKVVTIGLSAGAYAAIKYARHLGADRTLALGPQLTIDDQEGDVLPEWAALCTPAMRGMGLKAHDLHGTTYVLFDRFHHNDSETARRLHDYTQQGAKARIVPINVPSSGHIVYESLKGRQNLRSLIEMLVQPNTTEECAEQLRIATSQFRRRNTTNLYNKIKNGYQKHPKLIYDLLTSPRFCEDFQFQDILCDETLLFRVCARLNDAGYVQESQRLLRILIDYYAAGDYRLDASDRYTAGQPVMLDHRGRTLGYSTRDRRFTSSNIVWMEGDATPVGLTHVDHIAYPCVSLFGRRFFLDIEGEQIRAVTAPGRLQARCSGRNCGIRNHEGRYLTVIGDRETTWSPQQLSYETFSIVVV